MNLEALCESVAGSLNFIHISIHPHWAAGI